MSWRCHRPCLAGTDHPCDRRRARQHPPVRIAQVRLQEREGLAELHDPAPIVATVLLALGMSMISLPFKLLLFVMLDGWTRLVHGLVLSYR
ncbi:hypothetical protein J2W30_006158 [Variovorax boronicumulans]|nr:hypothetical protein [Variovorax boronicumulans]